MTFYRENVYRAYTAAVASASKSAIAYSKVEGADWDSSEFKEAADAFDEAFRDFEGALGALKEVLPETAYSKGRLLQHAWWCRHWLKKNQPLSCGNDPHQILESDLPTVLAEFEKWYREQSEMDADFAERMIPFARYELVNGGIREAWTVFKTEVVGVLDLPGTLDGHRLVREMFREAGPLSEVMSKEERQAFCQLLSGMYSLSRNPVMHNDVAPNPAEADVVVALLARCLSRVRALVTAREKAGKN